MRVLLAAWMIVAACRSKPAADPASKQQGTATAVAAESLPPMPPYPEPARGRLAVQSAGGAHEIKGEWPAEAGACERPPMLQVVAQVQGFGTIVLLALPEKDRVTSYPVTIVDTTGLPTAPASQVGVQVFRSDGPAAYQAAEGAVEVYAFEKTVSGRFGVTMRQVSTNSRIRYAGAFREIPLKQLDAAHCARADSAAKR